MLRWLNMVLCLYLGGIFLWYADLLVNNAIPAPHEQYVWAHEALLTWMVIVLWADRSKR